MSVKQARILIFGAGVIGSAYAVKFIKAGYKVTMLARSNRLKMLRENGLQYYEKDLIKNVKVDIIEKLQPNDVYDYIFVPVRYEQAESALLAIKDNQSKNIITMTNNSKGYSTWENILGKGRLQPAFPSAGGCIQDGVLHSQFAPKVVQPTIFGEINGQITERARTLGNLFNIAKIPYSIVKDMDAMQKTHAAVDIALSKCLYSGDKLREPSAVRSKESVHNMNLDIKAYLRLIEKAGVAITPSKLKIIMLCPMWLMDFVVSRVLNTKIAGDSLFGGHAGDSKDEIKLMEKDFFDFLQQNNVSIKTSV